MPITFFCAACGKRLQIATRKAGQMVGCPSCQSKVHVPLQVEQAEEAEPAPDTAPSTPPEEFDYGTQRPDFDEGPVDRGHNRPAYRPPRRRKKSSSVNMAIAGLCIAVVLGLLILVLAFSTRSARHEAAEVFGSFVVLAIVLPFAIAIYFLPSFIAFFRQHHQRFAILVLNFFAAWTVIAWAACLVWAFMAIDSKEHHHYHYHH